MPYLPDSTIRKFLRETFIGTPMKIPKKEQIQWLTKLKEDFEKNSRIEVRFNSEWDSESDQSIDLPQINLWIETGNQPSVLTCFCIGFAKNRTECWALSNRYYFDDSEKNDELFPVESLSQIDEMITKCKERLERRLLQEQKKGTAKNFTTKNLRARLMPYAESHQIDFSIEVRPNHIYIYIKKNRSSPIVIKLSSAKKRIAGELEKLDEYMEHALEHLNYYDKIQRAGGKGFNLYSLEWTKYKK